MTVKLYIITGVSRGLGASMFDLLINENCYVYAISRSFTNKQLELANKRIKLIKKDLSVLTDLDLEELKPFYKQVDEIIFINNASTIKPINKIGTFTEAEISNVVKTNSIAPMLIANHILKHNKLKKNQVLNISSGAAKNAIDGWSLYCTTKAANEMFFDTLQLENPNFSVVNYDPGILKTGMQEDIRNANEAEMKNVSKFKEFHEHGKLKSPIEAAKELIKLIQ